LEIEFDPNITTIVGDNEAGKTTVIRALRWITHNRPSGEGFHTIGKHKTRVKVFLDGRFATRTKSKTRNTYQLDDKSF
jgi:predicted ATP-dependent endonuclease of OLD family